MLARYYIYSILVHHTLVYKSAVIRTTSAVSIKCFIEYMRVFVCSIYVHILHECKLGTSPSNSRVRGFYSSQPTAHYTNIEPNIGIWFYTWLFPVREEESARAACVYLLVSINSRDVYLLHYLFGWSDFRKRLNSCIKYTNILYLEADRTLSKIEMEQSKVIY